MALGLGFPDVPDVVFRCDTPSRPVNRAREETHSTARFTPEVRHFGDARGFCTDGGFQ